LFSEQGYNDTTISKIATASEISFGSVFTYFSSKEELFHAAVIEPLEKINIVLLDFNPKADNPIMELERMVKSHINLFASLSNYLRLVVQVIGQHTRFKTQFEELNIFHNEFCSKLATLLENAQSKGHINQSDPIFAASTYFSLLLGLRLTMTDEIDEDFWASFVPFALQLFGPIDYTKKVSKYENVRVAKLNNRK
uniref:TetR/AcrR family transcriptional regulator n=1 Tax=Paenisporosarcina sp. TG20 TaxID=1211706 RepID=UPI0003709A98